jgi:hypothetical protein
MGERMKAWIVIDTTKPVCVPFIWTLRHTRQDAIYAYRTDNNEDCEWNGGELLPWPQKDRKVVKAELVIPGYKFLTSH